MTTPQDDTAKKLNDVFNYLASEDDSGEVYALIRQDSGSCDVCFPGTYSLCWVCGGDHCEFPPLPDDSQTTKRQMERTYLNLDCMDAERGLPSFPDKYFDLAIVDPPYGINRGGQSETFTKNPKHKRKKHHLKDWDNSSPSLLYFNELKRVSNHQIIWGANYYPQFLNPSMGWVFWDKGQDLSMSDGELAFTSFNVALRRVIINRGILNVEGGTIHPTQKPIALYRWLLTNYAKSGMKLLDTHVGSASSLIAFEEMGFEYVAFEKDPDYYRDSCKRLEAHRKQQSLFTGQEIFKASGGQTSLF